jgi:sporulation protein YabP
MEENKTVKISSRTSVQNIIIENRKKASISGVRDVESFDDENMILYTELGVLTVQGENLHINKLNTENGELIIEGDIDSCIYSDNDSPRGKGLSFFGKIFK